MKVRTAFGRLTAVLVLVSACAVARPAVADPDDVRRLEDLQVQLKAQEAKIEPLRLPLQGIDDIIQRFNEVLLGSKERTAFDRAEAKYKFKLYTDSGIWTDWYVTNRSDLMPLFSELERSIKTREPKYQHVENAKVNYIIQQFQARVHTAWRTEGGEDVARGNAAGLYETAMLDLKKQRRYRELEMSKSPEFQKYIDLYLQVENLKLLIQKESRVQFPAPQATINIPVSQPAGPPSPARTAPGGVTLLSID